MNIGLYKIKKKFGLWLINKFGKKIHKAGVLLVPTNLVATFSRGFGLDRNKNLEAARQIFYERFRQILGLRFKMFIEKHTPSPLPAP